MRSCPTTPQKSRKAPVPKDSLFSPTKRSSRKTEVFSPSQKEKDALKTDLFEAATTFKAKGTTVSDKTKKVYKMIQKRIGIMGGDGGNGAIYGELTIGSMNRVLDFMVKECGLTSQSIFMDVGSGLMKPNLHAAQYPGVRLSIGIELEEIRWKMAMVALKELLHDKTINHHTHSMPGDIEIATTLDPITHVYQYDLGFPPPLQQSIARKFNTSQHCEYLVSYRPPHRVIEEYGYKVTFVDQILTSMTGSGEGHTAYFYKRANTPPVLTAKEKKNGTSSAVLLTLPPRPEHPDDPAEARTLFCDKALYETCRLAAAVDNSELMTFVAAAEAEYHSAPPTRQRRSRVIHEATM